MDTNQPGVSPVPGPPSSTTKVLITNIPSAVTFAVAVALFLLPFFEINFTNLFALQNSGIGIAAGNEWKLSEKSFFGRMLDGGGDFSQNGKHEPNIYAIIALALGSAAFILSILKSRPAQQIAMVFGIFSAALLIGLWLDLRKSWNVPSTDNSLGITVRLNFQPTPWFYVSVIAFLVAAFFCYKRIELTRQ